MLGAGFQSPGPVQQSCLTTLGAAATGLGRVVGGAAIAIPKLKQLADTITALRGGSSLLGKGIGGLANALMGPFGLALGAAGIGLAIFMTQQGEAKQRTDALRSRSEEHTSELQSLMRISYAVFCLKKK